MRDYLTIGPTPSDEDCAQVGTEDYMERSQKETTAFIHQLLREFGEPPANARLTSKCFPHDFGAYTEVVCYYDDCDEESINYAFNIENNTPAKWDNEALKELGSH